MSYVDSQLLPGEMVVYRGRLHRLIFTFPLLVTVLLIAVLIMSIRIREELWVALLFALIAVAAFIPAWILYSSSEFAVTNKRVVMKVGMIRRRTLETLLSKVESIDVDQSVLGRMFGYGGITVVGTGGSKESFNRIGAPLEFRRQVQAAIAAAEESRGPAPAAVEARDERPCPFCAEKILKAAKVCRYCGREVTPA
jgi:uncharacterized membrane protein YdbT with pleckstrin-like domain